MNIMWSTSFVYEKIRKARFSRFHLPFTFMIYQGNAAIVLTMRSCILGSWTGSDDICWFLLQDVKERSHGSGVKIQKASSISTSGVAKIFWGHSHRHGYHLSNIEK